MYVCMYACREEGLWKLKEDPAGREAYLNETPGCKSVLPRIVKVLQASLIYLPNSAHIS